MREMKDSGIEWIGKIPKKWSTIPTKHCFTINNGSDPITDAGNTPVYGSGSKSFKTCVEYKEGPTVLLGRKGTVNIPQWIDGRYWNVDTAFDTKPKGNYSLKFFYYTAICFDYENYSTQTALPSMTQGNYLNIRLPYMPIPDQCRIADFLDAKCAEIDSLTADIQTQIDTLEQYKSSIITEAVTKGLNPDAEMKDSGVEWIGEIPREWCIKRVKYISDSLSKGNGITREDVKEDGNIQCVRYGEIYSEYENSFRKSVSCTNLENVSSPKFISKGDILFAGTGELIEEIGKNIVYLGTAPCLAGGDIVVMRHSQNPVFLNYALNSGYAQMQKSSGKAKLKVVHISAFDIGNIYIALPPIQEQEVIADFLETKCAEINGIITEKEGQIKILNEYKKSLIYEYVTGKKEVPADGE